MNTPLRTFGLNVGGSPLSYSSASIIYNDLMRSASQFFGGPNMKFDTYGWPLWVDDTTGPAQSIVGLNGYLPAGEYQLIAKGVGTIRIAGGFEGPAWTEINLDGSGKPVTLIRDREGFPDFNQMPTVIAESHKDNYVREIQFLLPGSNGRKFYAPFMANLHDFPVLRFMDLLQVNGSTVVNWADRKPNHHFSVSVSGIPDEDCIEIANTTGKHPWISIPGTANNDYIVQMARLWNRILHKDLTIYVEYSNEVWNGGMPIWSIMDRRRIAENSPLALWWYIARQDGHATNLFKDSLSPDRKCVRILARQAGYGRTLTAAQEQYAADGKSYDALSCSGYVQSSTDIVAASQHFATEPDLAVTEYINGMDSGIADLAGWLVWWKQQADAAGVPLMLYEAGQHLVAPAYPPAVPLLTAVNRDPRMKEKYAKLVASMPPGIGPIMWYFDTGPPGGWGCWGHKEYTDQHTSPKWEAIKRATWKQPELSSIID